MDYQKFIQKLPELYQNWGQPSVQPKSDKYQLVFERVRSLTSINVMQLLNWAVNCREADEIYCEVGCLQGASLIAALLDSPTCMACAIDNFLEFDPFGDSADRLKENLARFDLEERVSIWEGEFEEFFCERQQLDIEDKIGVYFYDGAQDYRSQFMGLLWAKKCLSKQAVIIAASRNFTGAKQATFDFVAGHGECQFLLDFSQSEYEAELETWNGLQVLSWDVERCHRYSSSFYQEKRQMSLIRDLERIQARERKAMIDSWHREALGRHAAKDYAAAERNYQQVLRWEIDNADALRNLGMLYYLQNRDRDALFNIERALRIDSSKAEQYYSQGLVLEKMGNVPGAIQAYQKAIAKNGQHIQSYNNLGNLLGTLGDMDGAELTYRQAISANPKHFGSYQNLGNILFAKQKIDEAIRTYQYALELNPNSADLYYNLGVALETKKEVIKAQLNYGYADYIQGKYQEAIAKFEVVLEQQTSGPQLGLIKDMAECYKTLNNYEKANALYRDGINRYPEEISFYFGLMSTLQQAGRAKEAVDIGTEALQRFPDNLFLKFYRQRILPIVYEDESEIDLYRQQFSQGTQELIQNISLKTVAEKYRALKEIARRTNFFLQYQGKNDLELQINYGNLAHKILAANYPQWIQPLSMPPLRQDGRIRVGYISAFMYTHTVGKLMLGWLKNRERERVEVHSYYLDNKVDIFTNKYQFESDRFHFLKGDLEAACQQIISDRLHILVFLDIGMHPPITQMAALRLAPIQCVTWGHPITSGLPTIDYFLSSDLMEPSNAEDHYSETLIRLPNIGISYAQPTIPELTATRADFQLREEAIVYLSCQSHYKYLPQYDYIFAAIAQQIPQAQFAFIESHVSIHITEQFQKRIARAFDRVGLKSENYCVFVPRLNQTGYFNLNLVSDIYLDTPSWSGGNTTLEAIACNLPVVTCPGEFMRGRHSYGILKMLGVTDTIAQTEADYIEIAVKLGRDLQWRESIVQRIKQRHRYLYDDRDCVAALSEFYQRAVKEGLAKTGG